MDFKTSPLPVSPHAVADSPDKLHPNLRPWSTRRLAEYPKMRLNPFSSSWKFSRNLINPGATCKLCLSFWVIRVILVCSPRHKESQTILHGRLAETESSQFQLGRVVFPPNRIKACSSSSGSNAFKAWGFPVYAASFQKRFIMRLGIATQSLNLLTTSLL